MEGMIAEIRLFAGIYAPKGWHLCDGTLLPVSGNRSLFNIIGTRFGGNGATSFAVPDLRGRTIIGAVAQYQSQGYVVGDFFGQETVALNYANIPAHNHAPIFDEPDIPSLGIATLYGSYNSGGQSSPTRNFLGVDDTGSGVAPYASGGTPAPMSASSIQFTDVQVAAPTVSIGVTGGGQPHPNMMPSIVLNYIICTEGIFPSRN